MIASTRHSCFRYLIAFGIVAVAASSSNAQTDGKVIAVPAHGLEVFGHILHRFGLEPVADIDQLDDLDAEETLVIAMGDLKLDELDKRLDGGLAGFLKDGGALLIASAVSDGGALKRWNLAIPGTKVLQVKASSYQGQYEECPMIVTGLKTSHPIFTGLERGIATNRPSCLRHDEADLHGLAYFSDDAYLAQPPIAGRDNFEFPLTFLCGSRANSAPDGRMVVMAGEGVFINSMLLSGDCDNFGLAWNTVKWLGEGPEGKRRHALLLEDGRPVTKFGLPLGMRIPPEAALLVFNKMLAEMDKENIFNSKLLEWVGHERAFRILWLIVGGVVCLLLVRRFLHARFHLETRVPLVLGRRSEPPPALSLAWQRLRAMEGLSSYWEPAQGLIREFFQNEAGLDVPFWDEQTGPQRIATQAEGGWWTRLTWQRRLDRLWQVARTPPSYRLSKRRFLAILRSLDETRDALQSGKLRLALKA